MNIRFAGKSIQGRREYNQDRILFKSEGDCFIAAVADGMGGYSGGEVASRIVAELCERKFEAFAASPRPDLIEKMLLGIVEESRAAIRIKAHEQTELKDMGTTLTVAAGCAGEYVVGNIGDSRTYLIDASGIVQLTRDNSFVQEYKSKYPDGEVEDSVLRNMSNALTRSLSGGDHEMDIYPGGNRRFTLEKGAVLLLCSDGLIIDKVGDVSAQLLKIVRRAGSPAKAANALIDWAYVNGSSDNISVILAYEGEWEAAEGNPVQDLIRRIGRSARR